MKRIRIFILLMIIALSNCISNLNYSSEIRKLVVNKQKNHQKEWKDARERSFMEKTVKTAFRSGEGEKLNTEMEGRSAEKTGTSSQEKSESEENSERRSKVKHKLTLRSKTRRTSTKSKTETKFISYIFTAILATMFIAKTVFKYVERHYKQKKFDSMVQQIENMKSDSYYMKKNEIEACTMSTLMLASNKNIILVYKLKLIYVRAYKKYYLEEECKNDCSSIKDEKLLAKCKLEKDSCDIFKKSEFAADFEEIHKTVDLAIDKNLKILKRAKSSACDQRASYKNIDDKVANLEKEVVELEDKIAVSLRDIANDAIKTFLNSILFGMQGIEEISGNGDPWFISDSYSKSKFTAFEHPELTAFKVVRNTYMEEPSELKKTMEQVKTFTQELHGEMKNSKNETKKNIQKSIKTSNENMLKIDKFFSNSITTDEKSDMIAQIDAKIKANPKLVEEENPKIELKSKKLENHLKNLMFTKTIVNFIRMIFSFFLIFDIAAGGMGVFNMIEGLLEVISKALQVAIAHIQFTALKDDVTQNKTQKYTAAKREMFDAWAQLALSIVYLTFFPASILLKGIYDAALKLNDMVVAFRQYGRQEKERNYYKKLGDVKKKHSDLFKNYNICELKFYGYLNILTVLNTIIKDEVELMKNSSKNYYDKLVVKAIQNSDSKEYIKNQIKELCSENIQFCSRNISGDFLIESLSFTKQEVINLKKEAIYGPYSALGVANTLEEFKSFIDLGYQPITSFNNFLKPGVAPDETKLKGNDINMLMGCRLCSKNSVIRHVEFLTGNISNIDDILTEKSHRCEKETPLKEKLSKCIYFDDECRTEKLKYLRLSSNYILYYEIIKRREDDGKEKQKYPGLNNIMSCSSNQDDILLAANQVNTYANSHLEYLKKDVGIWDSQNKKWMTEKPRPHEYDYSFNYNFKKFNPDVENVDIKLEYQGQIREKFDHYCLNNVNQKLIEIREVDYEKDIEIMKSLKYNWIFHPTPIIYDKFINLKGMAMFEGWEGLFKFYDHMNYIHSLRLTSEPFKKKEFEFTDFVDKLQEDCAQVCIDNKADSYDFNTCPNKAINYNYLTNKNFFKTLNENDKTSYTNIISKQTSEILPNSLDDDSYKDYKPDRSWNPSIKGIRIEIKEGETMNEHLVKNLSSKQIIEYIISNSKQYISFSTKFENDKATLSLKLFGDEHYAFKWTENQVEFNLSQIHNKIYVVLVSGKAEVADEDINTFKNSDYIQIPIQKRSLIYDSKVYAFVFVRPLPEMGLIRNKTYGKSKCLLQYNFRLKESLYIEKKGNYKDFIDYIYENYSSLTANEYNANYLNFVNLMGVKTNSSIDSRKAYSTVEQSSSSNSGALKTLKYHPFNIFDFNGDLGSLLFKKKECKDMSFSFSMPIKFHKNENADRSIYYRNLQIDKDNNIIESYELTGPDVREIYWLQFTNKPDHSTDDMTSANKYGYLPYYSFDYTYSQEYEDYLKHNKIDTTGMLYKKLEAEDMKIQITVWVAYDYRHRYNVSDLCKTCQKTKELLQDYEYEAHNNNVSDDENEGGGVQTVKQRKPK